MFLLLSIILSFYIGDSFIVYEDSNCERLISAPMGTVELVMPDSVKYISGPVTSNEGAFYECRGQLKKVTFSKNLLSIGKNAFQKCDLIEVLEFPSSLETIEEYAFYNMKNLRSIVFVNSNLMSIGMRAFETDRMLQNFVLPSNQLSRLDFAAFGSCDSITEFIFPNSVTSIDICLLSNCQGLISVRFPDNPKYTSISGYICEMCTKLTTVYIPMYVQNLGELIFMNCVSLAVFEIATENQFFFVKNDVLFKTTGELVIYPPAKTATSYEIPESSGSTIISTIKSTAFNGCLHLESLTLSKNIALIEEGAFFMSSNLKNIISNSPNYVVKNEMLHTADLKALVCHPPSSSYSNSIILHSGLTNLFMACFIGLKYVEKVDLQKTQVEVIPTRCFQECLILTTVILPPTLKITNLNSFSYCKKLETVTFSPNPNSENSASCELSVIGGASFAGCIVLKNLINFEGKCSKLTHINKLAFSTCFLLEIIILPDSVTTFDTNTFEYCIGLSYFKFPQNYEVNSIPAGTFRGCTKLENIVFPQNCVKIGSFAFESCINFDATSNIPDSVQYIESSAFQNCTKLIIFTIPRSIIDINAEAFNRCDNLISVLVPKSIKDIKASSFFYCKNLAEFVLIEDVNEEEGANEYYSVVDGILYNKDITKLCVYPPGKKEKSFNVPSTVSEIGLVAFYGAKNLERVVLADAVKIIRFQAFFHCDNLECGSVLYNKETEGLYQQLKNGGLVDTQLNPCPTTQFTAGKELKGISYNFALAFFSLIFSDF